MAAHALLLGVIATTRGLGLAVDLGAAAIILMNVATLVLGTYTRITPSWRLAHQDQVVNFLV